MAFQANARWAGPCFGQWACLTLIFFFNVAYIGGRKEDNMATGRKNETWGAQGENNGQFVRNAREDFWSSPPL